MIPRRARRHSQCVLLPAPAEMVPFPAGRSSVREAALRAREGRSLRWSDPARSGRLPRLGDGFVVAYDAPAPVTCSPLPGAMAAAVATPRQSFESVEAAFDMLRCRQVSRSNPGGLPPRWPRPAGPPLVSAGWRPSPSVVSVCTTRASSCRRTASYSTVVVPGRSQEEGQVHDEGDVCDAAEHDEHGGQDDVDVTPRRVYPGKALLQ